MLSLIVIIFFNRPQYQIDKRTMGAHHGQRVMVRTCNGLELRDPSLFVETSASELVESSVLFPSLDSRDELHPRYVKFIISKCFECIFKMAHRSDISFLHDFIFSSLKIIVSFTKKTIILL